MREFATKKIIIVGNSGFARECHLIVRQIMKVDPTVDFGGFLSFEGYKADLLELSSYFLGIDSEYTFAPNEYAVIGIGDPALRRKAFFKLKERKVPFFTLIAPHAYVDPTIKMGEANIVTSDCFISCNIVIGDGNIFNGAVRVGHDTRIGSFNFIGPAVQVGGNSQIGNDNSLGTLSTLLPHCKIGDNNIVAPLSAVYKGCGSNLYLAGNPALKIGTRD